MNTSRISRIEAIRLADLYVSKMASRFPDFRMQSGAHLFDALRIELVKAVADKALEEERTLTASARLRSDLWRAKRRMNAPSPSVLTPCDVLFSGRRTNHLKNLIPVMQELEEAGISTAMVVFSEEHRDQVQSAGLVAIFGPWRRSFVIEERERMTMLVSLRRCWRTVDDADPFFEAVVRLLGECLRADAFAANILSATRPQMVIAGNPHSYESYCLLAAAKTLGVQRGAVQHGDISTNDPSWAHQNVDHIFVWGKVSRDVLAQRGHPESSIHIVVH